MKETVLDVLLYLFETYFYDDPDAVRDRASLQAGVISAGFSPTEVTKAFDWLDALDEHRPDFVPGHGSEIGPVRVYVPQEIERLDEECRGFLMFLLANGVLDIAQHELVIDRAMALDQDEIDVDDLKWVVLMVLFNQPGQEAAFAWMESYMFQDQGELVH
jgi:Smg protein